MSGRGRIYIVATPIGNLEDIGDRAKRVLAEVDLIAAEDTRRARQLLNHLGIGKKELLSYYDQVEQEKAPKICERLLAEDKSLALISDAGTPAISDPGYRLVREAHQQGIPVHPIPGPSSMTALLSCSGLPTDRFLFIGFLPPKKTALVHEIQSWRQSAKNVVFFESTRRLVKSLAVIAEIYPGAEICIGRELTKLYEDIITGSIETVLLLLEQRSVLKGEAVIYLSLPKDSLNAEQQSLDMEDLRLRLRKDLDRGESFKDLLKKYQSAGLSRSQLYQLMIQLKEGKNL
ncbi:MAG: 16S rRNA (cytidine(1402)-2'-O)-methyltransferase [Oligoflexus sp.]